jgi:cytochrome c oxidase cbb3-type subunit I/II
VFDHPFLWGSRRIGPDLARTGRKIPSPLWHVRHMNLPTDTSPGSIMPPYPHLLEKPLDFAQAADSVAAMKAIGVPYSDETVAQAEVLARRQADEIAAKVVAEAGPAGIGDRKVVALVAYLMRIGTDLDKPVAAPSAEGTSVASAGQPSAEQGGGQ